MPATSLNKGRTVQTFKDPNALVPTLDAVAEPDDVFQVEVSYDITGGLKLYVHVNGITCVRIGRIQKDVGVDVVTLPKST